MSVDNKSSAGTAGLGSRFLNGLKGLIIEEEAPEKKEPTKQASEALTSKETMAAPTASSAGSAAIDSPMAASLMQLVLNRTTAYTALTDAMTPLEEIISDEMTRYRAAFAVIKKNRTVDQLIQAIELQHMQILENEVTRFKAQAREKEDADVHARLNEAKTLNGNIEAANAELGRLRHEMESRIRTIEENMERDRLRINEIDREVEEKRNAIASVQQQFDNAVSAVKESLQQAQAKIVRYLA